MNYLKATVLLMTFLMAAPSAAQNKPIVMIDPGHGGEEIGVEAGDLLEKDLVLRLGFVLADEFVRHGFDVRLTRTGDTPVAWPDRRSKAEDVNAVALIMLHMNGNEDANKHGTEIYINENDPKAVAMAESVAQSIRDLETPVEIMPKPWPFLQSPTATTIMLENGHLTNPVEKRMLTSSDYHRILSRHIVMGTMKALEASH